MRPIDGNKLKKAVEYSRDVKIGYLNHCAEAGHNPDDKDLIEANIKWHEDMLKLIDDASTIEMQRDHLADDSKKGDLISRADAIDALENCEPGEELFMIENLPSAQPEILACGSGELVAQPEIIRCKDCKNWDMTWTNDFSPNYHYCPMVDGVRKEDWFCADAEERRTDE